MSTLNALEAAKTQRGGPSGQKGTPPAARRRLAPGEGEPCDGARSCGLASREAVIAYLRTLDLAA